MRLALFQPDIAQNTGTILRLAACMNVGVDIIEPCGFPLSAAGLRRAGMDYIETANMTRHADFSAFQDVGRHQRRRLVLLTTKSDTAYTDFRFSQSDTLLAGRESAGVPDSVHEAANARIVIPMAEGMRSLNVAVAMAMVLGEALRQTGEGSDLRRRPESA